MRNKMDATENYHEDTVKRKRFTMIQRNSEPVRREDSIDNTPSPSELSPNTPKENAPPPSKKSRGRPQKQYWTHEWSDRATEALIELWSQKEELYNKQHPLFYVKESKDRAVDEIRDRLCDQGFDVTSDNILSKFQSLRTYFCTQRTKSLTARRSAGGGNYMDESECKWRFYKSLIFLDDNMKPRDSHRKMELMNAEYSTPPSFTAQNDRGRNYETFYSAPNPQYVKQEFENNGYHSNNNIQNNETSLDEQLAFKDGVSSNGGGVVEQLSPKPNKHEDFIFGELVGNMIHQLPSGKHKDMVKLEIQQLIIKAKYTSTDQHS